MSLRWQTSGAVALCALAAGCGTTAHTRPSAKRPARAEPPPRGAYGAVSRTLKPSAGEPEARGGASDLVVARDAAAAFFHPYIRFLYGQLPLADIPDVSPSLRRQLAQGQALTTPTERVARPRLTRLGVSPAGPPISVIATATVESSGVPIHLVATLEPRGHRWVVVAVGG